MQPFSPFLAFAEGYGEGRDKRLDQSAKMQAQNRASFEAVQQANLAQQRQQQQQLEYFLQPQRDQQRLQQEVQARAELQQQELSQAEKIRQQKLEAQKAWIDQNTESTPGAGDGRFTQEETIDLKTKLQTGIDMYQERQRRAQAKRLEEQDKLTEQRLMKENAQQETLARLQAQSAKERTQTVYDEEDGHKIVVYRGMDGKEHVTHLPPAKDTQAVEDLRIQREQRAEERKWLEDAHKEVAKEFVAARNDSLKNPKESSIPDHLATPASRAAEAKRRHEEMIAVMRPDSEAAKKIMSDKWDAYLKSRQQPGQTPPAQPPAAASPLTPVPQWAKDKPLAAIDAELKRRLEEANQPKLGQGMDAQATVPTVDWPQGMP